MRSSPKLGPSTPTCSDLFGRFGASGSGPTPRLLKVNSNPKLNMNLKVIVYKSINLNVCRAKDKCKANRFCTPLFLNQNIYRAIHALYSEASPIVFLSCKSAEDGLTPAACVYNSSVALLIHRIIEPSCVHF